MDVATMSTDFSGFAETSFPHETIPSLPRRLSDKILVVFHHACDSHDLEVAGSLLGLLEVITMRGPRPETGNRRLNVDHLVNAYERLWRLRNPGRS